MTTAKVLRTIQSKPLEEIPFIPLFVYGTLRIGGSLHHLIEPHIIKVVDDVFIYGDLYESSQGIWPVLKVGSRNKVKGTLVALTLSQDVMASIFEEELLFGYDITWQSIFDDNPEDDKYSEALVCTWDSEEFLGHQIEHGDWFSHLASKQ